MAINSSMTVEEILQLTADAARAILGARPRDASRSLAPDPRLRRSRATSPPRLGGGDAEPVAAVGAS